MHISPICDGVNVSVKDIKRSGVYSKNTLPLELMDSGQIPFHSS